MRTALAALLLLGPIPMLASAQSLYRCEAAGGAISIQSDPCPAGSTQVWKRDAAPEPPRTPEQEASVAARQAQAEADARTLSRLAGTAVVAPGPAPAAAPAPAPVPTPAAAPLPRSPCRVAHEFAAAARAHEWLELSESQRYRMDEWVAEQCRDPEE